MKCRCQVVKNLFDFEVHFYLWPPCEKLSKFFWTEQTPNNLWIRVSLHFSKHSVNLSVCLFVCLSVCQSLVHLSVSQSVCLSLSVCPSISSLSIHVSVSICSSVHPSIFTHLPICPSFLALINWFIHFFCVISTTVRIPLKLFFQ